MNRFYPFWFFSLLAFIYFAGWILQAHLLLNWDVSWLIHAARRLLAGGSYVKNFPDINPPLIIYLYIPVVLLNKFFPINIIDSLRIYIFLLITLSLIMSFKLCDKKNVTYFMTLVIAAVFLLVPVYEFGQREHLLILFVLPYFYLTANRLENKSIPIFYSLWIGFMAGIGFALKPYFYLTFGLIELYCIYYQKNILAWIKPETFMIIAVTIVYIISIFIFHSDYIHTIIPLAMRTYYTGVSLSWASILLYPIMFFCAFSLLFYFMQSKKSPYHIISTIFALAMIGFLFAYIIQRTLWYYHLLPAYALAVLLFMLLFYELFTQNRLKKHEYFLISFFAIFVFSFIFRFAYALYHHRTDPPNGEVIKLIQYLKNHAEHQTVYFFTTTPVYEFPAIDYAHVYPASNGAFLGWISGLLKREKENPTSPQLLKDKFDYINFIADELNTLKPNIIFVDVMNFKSNIQDFHYDHLAYFSQSRFFQKAWANYHYITTIEQPNAYKFQIYQRNYLEPVTHLEINNL